MRRSLAVLPLAFLLAAAGCGSSSSSSDEASSSSSSSSSSASAAKSGDAVTMKNTAFKPKDLSVKVGQKVTWTNEDAFDHNVVATKGGTFKSSDFGQGKTYSYTPKKAGTIDYECTLHPGMTAKLEVK
jgi:plastocyanin